VADMLRAACRQLAAPMLLPLCTSTTGEVPPDPFDDCVGLVRSDANVRAELAPARARAGLARPRVSSGGGGGVGVLRWLLW
jgi:hypothetical protein